MLALALAALLVPWRCGGLPAARAGARFPSATRSSKGHRGDASHEARGLRALRRAAARAEVQRKGRGGLREPFHVDRANVQLDLRGL